MTSILALIGGEEFSDGFEEVHAQLAEIAYRNRQVKNSHALRIVFLPTCAAHDGPETVQYWCDQASQRLGALGCDVAALQIIDQESANNPDYAHQIANADWIYLGGGYPHTGVKILTNTRALAALHHARKHGALISGASGGAMLICARSWVITPEFDEVVSTFFNQGGNADEFEIPLPPSLDCLGIIPNTLCWPHLNQFFSMKWVERGMLPAGCTMIGIDEQTAVVRKSNGDYQVLGMGKAVIIDPERQVFEFHHGQHFTLNHPQLKPISSSVW